MRTVTALEMRTARHGRHRHRSARAFGLPALIALAGTLVATVPNYAYAAPLPIGGGAPPTRACYGSATPSASASPSGSVNAFGLPSASDSQSSTSPDASASATASATARPSTSGIERADPTATSSTRAPGLCGVEKAGAPTTSAGHSASATATPPRSASPSRSDTPTTPPASTPGAVSSASLAPSGLFGSEATQPPFDAQEPYGPITRAQIMQRALAWVEQQVPYSQTAWWVDAEGSYRQDCSGYVSMAWGLDQAIDFWTGNLATVSYPIAAAQLLPGDILLSTTHTVLFAGWADGAHTVFDFYEESHPGTVAHYVTDASIADFLNAGFVPYRYDGLVGPDTGPFATPTSGIPLAALGPLAQALAPEGKDVQRPAPAWWQTGSASDSAPETASKRPPPAAQAADLEPAAAAIPEQEAGSVGIALGGSALLFAGLSIAMTQRRTERTGGARPRRRH